MAIDDETHGVWSALDHAPHGARTDLSCASHSAELTSYGNTVIGPRRTNRKWSSKQKARITAESFEPGANITAIARRYDVGLGLLHSWRRKVRERRGLEPISFVPLAIEDETPPPARSELEIEMGGARIHIRGVVDGVVLRTVFDALRPR